MYFKRGREIALINRLYIRRITVHHEFFIYNSATSTREGECLTYSEYIPNHPIFTCEKMKKTSVVIIDRYYD